MGKLALDRLLAVKSLAALLLLLGGCATEPAYFKPEFAVRDAPTEQRFYLKVQNTTKHAICFDPANWPNAAGEIDTAADRVFIEVGEHRFPMANLDTGYCPGCATKLGARKSLGAFVKYSDFALPAEYRDAPKTLIFEPLAHRCYR